MNIAFICQKTSCKWSLFFVGESLLKFSFSCLNERSLFVSDKWSPALQIRTVLLSIQALLSAPNPDDPLANDVAEQWKVNESQAIQTGKLLVLSRVISHSMLTYCANYTFNT